MAPPFLGLPPGTQIPTDAVPTSVVQGPDGAYYVTQLTGFPFQKGDANIWRVVPGQAPTVYASGLTNLTDLAFADDGSLYAVQISVEGLLNGPIGALVRINPGSSQHETIAGGLFAPYGVALRGDSAYVSTCTVCAGGGEVVEDRARRRTPLLLRLRVRPMPARRLVYRHRMELLEGVRNRLESDLVVWLTTITDDGAPAPYPVWFVVDGEDVVVFSQPSADNPQHRSTTAGVTALQLGPVWWRRVGSHGQGEHHA